MTKWEYVTVPLLVHATKQILDNWGQDGWELVQVVPGPQPGEPGGVPEAAASAVVRLASERLAELGLTLPPVAAPVAAYVPAVRFGDLVFTSGQLPLVDGQLRADRAGRRRGQSGGGVRAAPGSPRSTGWPRWPRRPVSMDAIARIVKVVVYVASAPGFTGQPQVANGASELLGEIFGGAGRHARSAVGVAVLPLERRWRWSWSSRSARRPSIQPV